MPSVRILLALCLLFSSFSLAPPLRADSAAIPALVAPESVGFDSTRLAHIDASLERLVADGEFAGFVTVLARHGQVVRFRATGVKDTESRSPMQLDTIFRIFSMTKPVTGVAMLMLYEEGKWSADDPLAKHLPEFAGIQVLEDDGQGGQRRVAPRRAPTMSDLMRHTAGFTYGFFGDTPTDALYREKNPLLSTTAEQFVDTLASLPLAYHPGDAWRYSIGVDIQGALVERLSGQSLPAFMRTRIFEPLGMTDTGFAVPAEKLDRLATLYRKAPGGALTAQPRDPKVSTVPSFASGGGGLYSTAKDYFRFAQMLARGGELDGVRLLAPATVRLMRSNHLPDHLRTGQFGIGFQVMRPGFGFGYDVAVFDDPIADGSITGAGTFLWDGAAATWFWVDPSNDLVFVGMVQRFMDRETPNLQKLTRVLVNQALVHPER